MKTSTFPWPNFCSSRPEFKTKKMIDTIDPFSDVERPWENHLYLLSLVRFIRVLIKGLDL